MNSGRLRVGLIAGEPSGDALGAALIGALRRRVPDVECFGVAGPAMRGAGCRALYPAEDLAVMGIVEVLAHLPRLLRQLCADPPDVLVGIDAPDFNLPVEARLRRAGIRTVHYVSPSVWAWREGRVKQIAGAVDRMLTLFPFEARFYERHRVPVTQVGHPLQATLRPIDPAVARAALGLPPTGPDSLPVLALLPGSRAGEYRRLAPLFLATAQWLREQGRPCHLLLPLVNQAARTAVEAQLRRTGAGLSCTLVDGRAQEVMAAADAVLLASGTATLEAMLLQRPMVVAYRLAPLTYAIARRLVRTPHVAIPNLLAGRAVVPEFIQHAATPAALGEAIAALLEPAAGAAMRAELAALRPPQTEDPAELAARAVLEVAGWT
ncbi:MAG TPA: lipid-A-disaccharide synthase [Immundisolibacter sp.]|nr:lipid-A-disaccharide synthase [Immundisolibacter sp.]